MDQKGKARGEEKWQQAVEKTLKETKGIGQKRKELFLERLRLNLKGDE